MSWYARVFKQLETGRHIIAVHTTEKAPEISGYEVILTASNENYDLAIKDVADQAKIRGISLDYVPKAVEVEVPTP